MYPLEKPEKPTKYLKDREIRIPTDFGEDLKFFKSYLNNPAFKDSDYIESITIEKETESGYEDYDELVIRLEDREMSEEEYSEAVAKYEDDLKTWKQNKKQLLKRQIENLELELTKLNLEE